MKYEKNTKLTFAGQCFNYSLPKPEEYRIAVHHSCACDAYTINQKKIWGIKFDQAIATLRVTGFKIPSDEADQWAMFKALGFNVDIGMSQGKEYCTIIYTGG